MNFKIPFGRFIVNQRKISKLFRMKYTPADIEAMLMSEGEQKAHLFDSAYRVKCETVGDGVYLRGLIEYSNICRKNCLYCGIRRDNDRVGRYTLNEQQVLDAAQFAYESNYGSVVIQAGEITSQEYIAKIEELIRKIKKLSEGKLGITLSLGEQTLDTYERWFDAGAHRYLLRVESSNRALYEKIHPSDGFHNFDSRLQALRDLRRLGYQLGTGVMIGLPGQTIADLATDIEFMRQMDIDMCGMGPYIESENTPLTKVGCTNSLLWRFGMALKMIATLRHVMPDINIAATTALEAIDAHGREKAIACGANVVMPNITPMEQRASYALYNNKPINMPLSLGDIKFGEWGDSLRFNKRNPTE